MVDFDRDLGSLQRKLIKPSDSKAFVQREQRKIFDKITSVESMDEIHLMIVAGMI